jgi:hypothetical protein
MAKPPVWIVNHPEGWAVRREGSERASSVHRTQEQAIDEGRRLAQQDHTELIVQDRHGQIRSKDSFGNDPFPPRDKER